MYKFAYLLTSFGFICDPQKFYINTFLGGRVTIGWKAVLPGVLVILTLSYRVQYAGLQAVNCLGKYCNHDTAYRLAQPRWLCFYVDVCGFLRVFSAVCRCVCVLELF